jgi:pimeloyl-ACP methyl ester carboxylesterase
VLQGKEDVIPVENAKTIAELLGADLHLLPRCGHVPYVEARDEFVELLNGFLPRIGQELGVRS